MSSLNNERENCVMDELVEIKRKLSEHDREMTDIKVSLALNTESVQRAVTSNEQLVKCLHNFELTMRDVSNNLVRSEQNDIEMKESIDKLDRKLDTNVDMLKKQVDSQVEELDSKLEELEDRGKIDIAKKIRDNFGRIILVIIMALLASPALAEIFLKVFG